MAGVFDLLSSEVREVIRKRGYLEATPPQNQAIPRILKGENVLLISPTGSGKTEAVFFPIFHKLLELQSKEKGIFGLYITPLRALNRDILKRMEDIAQELGIRMSVRHGDTTSYERRKQLLEPPSLLITTPETLQAIIPAKKMGKLLKCLRFVVVDEIHEIVTDKRGAQLSLALERLREITNHNFQRIGLSATIGSVEEVAKFLGGVNEKVNIVSTSREGDFQVSVETISPTSEDDALSKKLRVPSEIIAKLRRIKEIIEKYSSVLIFVNTRQMAEILGSRLSLLNPRFNFDVHHGSLSREMRMNAEKGFKEEEIKAVICTSSLELGIDVGSIDYVIQYSSPRQVTRLVQRVGRSGHRVGQTSKGTILSMDIDDVCESAVLIRDAINDNLESIVMHNMALDVLAHQIAGVLLDKGETTIEELYRIFRRSWLYQNIDYETIYKVTNLMKELWLISLDGGRLRRRIKTWKYYYENLSMIPDVKHYEVFDLASERSIGTLDEEFVSTKAEKGLKFIIHGQPWRIVSIEEDRVNVERVDNIIGAVPSWEGELIPVSFEAAQKVGRLRESICRWIRHPSGENPFEGYPMDEESMRIVVEKIKKQIDAVGVVPVHNRILIEGVGDFVVIHACFGSKVNETLGRIISDLLTTRIGTSVAMRSTPYHILFQMPKNVDSEIVVSVLGELEPQLIDNILKITLKRSNLYRWRLTQVAKRFGAIEKNGGGYQISSRKLAFIFSDTPIAEETIRELLTEKLDIKETEGVLKAIKEGRIQVCFLKSEKPSPLTEMAIQWGAKEIISPSLPVSELLTVVKERLLNKRVKLVCVWASCEGWETVRTVGTLPEYPQCPKCKSRLLAVLPYEDSEFSKILKLRKNGAKLSKEEEKIFQNGIKTANLVINYGKKAIICLAGRGIGPLTANRILSKELKTESDFYRAIIDAEKEFVRTREFWNKTLQLRGNS
ncbi:MAG: DEAD/DEAH box helicase [Candidatus Freyarchaeota archaeon]|nr:DEAD/DEAH box helicase [Candidatus Jordarchaeia archaeon]MBS7269357.1 DEAD/DEAH box helicase [Candidatus Jordarchaeia archaeon]MBS7280161.1 DEAD/DEAH box helicase [Candidatus Jordarchaeia archaeon]